MTTLLWHSQCLVCRQHRQDRKDDQPDDSTALDETVNRSDDSMEALIGVGSDHLDPALMQSGDSISDDEGLHSRGSSVSLSLTEQYSIASCSYPPLPAPDLQQLASGIPLSAAASAELEQDHDFHEHIV